MKYTEKYIVIASCTLVFAFAVLINPSSITSPQIPSLQLTQTVEAAVPAKPTYITIPTAMVNTNIVDVGVTKDGKLDVPPNYTEVGWYKYGTRPGEMGSAVLDGHVDNGGSIPGPFKHLRNVRAGDDIYVTMSNGKVLHYKITEKNVYKTEDFPGEKVFHEKDNKYLKLITCHGKFVRSMDTYDERLIVTAVLVS